MRARNIKRLRKSIKHYKFWYNSSNSGIDRFYINRNNHRIIYGKNVLDAVRRYFRKNPFIATNWITQTYADNAVYAVLEVGKPIKDIVFLW